MWLQQPFQRNSDGFCNIWYSGGFSPIVFIFMQVSANIPNNKLALSPLWLVPSLKNPGSATVLDSNTVSIYISISERIPLAGSHYYCTNYGFQSFQTCNHILLLTKPLGTPKMYRKYASNFKTPNDLVAKAAGGNL